MNRIFCNKCGKELYGTLEQLRKVCDECTNKNRNVDVNCHACRGDAGYETHTCGKA